MCFKGGNGGTNIRVNEFTVAPQISPVADCLIMNGLSNLKMNQKMTLLLKR
jgi:hypothetical protein